MSAPASGSATEPHPPSSRWQTGSSALGGRWRRRRRRRPSAGIWHWARVRGLSDVDLLVTCRAFRWRAGPGAHVLTPVSSGSGGPSKSLPSRHVQTGRQAFQASRRIAREGPTVGQARPHRTDRVVFERLVKVRGYEHGDGAAVGGARSTSQPHRAARADGREARRHPGISSPLRRSPARRMARAPADGARAGIHRAKARVEGP